MGQLGLPDEISTISRPTELEFFRNKSIVKIACGKLHTLVLCENNELYTWGVNDDCALGREGVEEEPELVDFPGRIVDMAAGASYSALLTDRGQVFGCGTFKSSSGIIGFSAKNRFQPTFVRLGRLRQIRKIVGGHNHLVMIDAKGCLWTVGANESYQLGVVSRERNKKRSLEPTQISTRLSRKINHNFVVVGAGGFHSVAVNTDHAGFGWGSNYNGQLGNGTFDPSEKKMEVLVPEIESVSCGANHTLLLTKDRKLFGCGDNSMHQLGIDAGKTVSTPSFILDRTTSVSAGCDFSIARVENGLYGWGANMSGELGADEEEISKPTKIDFDFGEIVDFVCGSDFTVVLTK